MSKSITVQFDDGSSHVYDDVPDDVDEQQIKDRAVQDFAKNPVSVQSPEQIQQQQNEIAKANEPSLGEKIVGAAQVPIQAIAEHPIAAASALGAYKALNLGNKYLEGKNIDRAIAQQQAATAADAQALARERMTERMARPGMTAPVKPSPTILDSAGNPMNRPSPITSAPVAPQVPSTAPPVTRPRPQPSILDHASSIVRKLALSKILPAAAVGMELFGTNQEEIDTLKKAEALKRAQGWKPLNER